MTMFFEVGVVIRLGLDCRGIGFLFSAG